LLTSDEGKIAQVIRNFISNALKFTLAGEVRVHAVHELDKNRLLFAVTDTGIGIAHEDRLRIFEEFSQIDSPTQRLVKSTGLGLSLCRRLAVVLQGEIFLTSEVGVGSTFTLSVPPVIGLAAENPAPEAFSEIVRQPSIEPFGQREKYVVLVVDDDPA